MDKVPKRIAPGDGCALTFRVSPPIDAHTTKAYFHRDDPETDAIYKIDEPEYLTLALPPPPVSARVVYSINGEEGEIQSVARTPMHNPKGDTWSMPLAVVPPYSVEASPTTQVIPAGTNPSANPSVDVRTTADRATGTVRPEVPQGWNVEPKSATVSFTESGQRRRIQGAARRSERGALSRARNMDAGRRDYSEGYSWSRVPTWGILRPSARAAARERGRGKGSARAKIARLWAPATISQLSYGN